MKKFVFFACLFFLFGNVAFSGDLRVDDELKNPGDLRVENERNLKPVGDLKAEIEPEHLLEIEKESTSITIKTNVLGVDVFLNGIYQGKTDLKIVDLLPGFYHLELKKKGYETIKYVIRVRRGYELEYNFTMQKIYGTISVRNVPKGATVEIVNNLSSNLTSGNNGHEYNLKVEPGFHEVVVRKFGFIEFSKYVEVGAYEVVPVYVEMNEAPFILSDFSVNKDSFNPEYNGRLGSCSFSFNVTASSTAKVQILDFCGTVVWEYEYKGFDTWEQFFTWNGRDKFGNLLPDGMYTAVITADGKSSNVCVTIDREISYPVLRATKVGGGVGNLPMAFKEDSNYSLLNLQTSIQLYDGTNPVTKEYLLSLDGNISGGLLFNFAKHFEISFNIGTYLGDLYQAPLQVCASFKIYDGISIGQGTFCYGGLLRFGHSSEKLYWPYGVDCGNGFGAAALFGYDVNNLYIGTSSQFISGASEGNFNIHDSVWNNGLCVSYDITRSLKLSAWGSLDSAIGIDMIRAVNCGLALDCMPESSAFIININVDAKIISDFGRYYSAGVNLSYLF